jgi:hypothetical protein
MDIPTKSVSPLMLSPSTPSCKNYIYINSLLLISCLITFACLSNYKIKSWWTVIPPPLLHTPIPSQMQKYMHLLFSSLNSPDKTLLRVLLHSINLFLFLHFASMQQHYCIKMLPLSSSAADPSLLSCKMTALKSLYSPLFQSLLIALILLPLISLEWHGNMQQPTAI